MIVNITDYGKTENNNFVEYSVSDLTSDQMEFLNDNLGEETEIDGNLFKLKMYLAKKIHLSQFKLTKCLLKNLVWNMLTVTVQRRILTSFTEHQSVVMKELLLFLLKNMQVHSPCGLLPSN